MIMKKWVCVLTSMMLLFSFVGCASTNDASENASGDASAVQNSFTPEPTGTPTPVPTPTTTPEPESELGYARADGAGLIYAFFNRGEVVEVIGEDGDYYVLSLEGQEVLVEKRLIAMLDAEEYSTWTGYARSKASVYASFHMIDEAVETLTTNTQLTVLADLDGCYLVQLEDGMLGYIKADQVSKSKISSGGSSGNSSGGSDGGDISLGACHKMADQMPFPFFMNNTSEEIVGQAKVLADGVEAYVRFINRNDSVKVIDEDDSYYFVLESDGILYIEKFLIRFEDDGEYEQWNGYAQSKAPLFNNFWFYGDSESLSRNTEMVVLDDLGYCYLVDVAGTIGYLATDQVSTEKLKSSESSNNGGSSEWTDPVY